MKWPMSAYFASPPVIANTTTPKIANIPILGKWMTKSHAYHGLTALKTSGFEITQGSPFNAIHGNQTRSINQPNKPPILLVPRHCGLNKTNKLTKVAITAHCSPNGSYAPSILIAGVIIPSAASKPAAVTTKKLIIPRPNTFPVCP